MTGRWRGPLTKPEEHLKVSKGLQALWYGEGLAFAVQLAADASGGRVTVGEKGLRVEGARSVTLRLAAATSFKGRDPEAACADVLRVRRPYDELLARHMTDHRSLFRRVRLDLGSTERNALPTDERLAAVQKGASDPGLAAIYFQYGRYLLIASSRPGGQPANLQGLWNDDLYPSWGSKYTININTEMNYWPAEVTESRGVPRAAVRHDRGAARGGPPDRANAVRGARLRRPPQHRSVACGGTRRRRALGNLAAGRGVALDAPLRALRLQRRSRVSEARLSGAEGSIGVPARLPGRRRCRAAS